MARGSKAAAKTAGAVKGAAKALAGYPGIFHHLAGEHGEVSAMMQRLAASSRDSQARREVFAEMCRNLLAHAHGEEEVFYPGLKAFPEVEPLVARCLEDHARVEQHIEQLAAMDPATAEWEALFDTLKSAVEDHVAREEQELFPKAKDLLDAERAREMESQYESIEEREKARL